MKDIAVVFDCGATNVRVIAMNTKGEILSCCSMANETDEDPYYEGGRIWDLDKLWGKLCKASRKVTSEIDVNQVVGVTVTTFGVDGAFVDVDGQMLYPIISWQCDRTQPIMAAIDRYVPLEKLYRDSGVYPYAFNTINKMVWFRENRPEVMDKAHRFLFIPSLLINKLSGVFKNDTTMMGTSMMANILERVFSEEILAALGLENSIFGEISEPGEQVGEITNEASELTGLLSGTPVFLAGHDTQFAILGSGAKWNEPVLSSGTWEILMVRSLQFQSGEEELKQNITTELDAEKGGYNIGQNWLGSGVLEWFSKYFYPELSGNELYETMIEEAEKIEPSDLKIMINPAFYDDGTSGKGGTIMGLTIETKRQHIYRAFLEGLAFRLRESLDALEQVGQFKAPKIICVGGGSKNRLWNKLRADVCNVPIQLIDQKETTVLGAAMIVFKGAGVFDSIDLALQNVHLNNQLIHPNKEMKAFWDGKYEAFKKMKSE